MYDETAAEIDRDFANDLTERPVGSFGTTGASPASWIVNAHQDIVGSTSSTGTVGRWYRYDPWGTLVASGGTGFTPMHRFQGSFGDLTAGLVWMVNRWYDPTTGRFLSEDSLLGEPRNPDSRHRYAYGEGDPVNTWDPDGCQSSYKSPSPRECQERAAKLEREARFLRGKIDAQLRLRNPLNRRHMDFKKFKRDQGHASRITKHAEGFRARVASYGNQCPNGPELGEDVKEALRAAEPFRIVAKIAADAPRYAPAGPAVAMPLLRMTAAGIVLVVLDGYFQRVLRGWRCLYSPCPIIWT